MDNVSFGEIIRGVSLTVVRGEWTAVAGPWGAGKTTLLSLVAGVRLPTEGTVRWLTPAGTSKPWLGGCAWIGQQTVLLPGCCWRFSQRSARSDCSGCPDGRTDDPTRTRALLRTELVTAVDAWPEMPSLGASDQLAQRTLRRLTAFEDSTPTTALAVGGVRAVTAIALFLTVLLARPVTTLVFIALLVAGVMANAERLVASAGALVEARRANAHLGSVDEIAVPSIRATYDGSRLNVSGYRLPETPIRAARDLACSVSTGETLVVTGASGSGKTTLVTAITVALRRRASATITAVLADDHLFTGTIAGNIRMADPTATDADITELLDAFALTGLEPQTAVGVGGRPLSGGEQRRLHLARALVTRPDVLVIDEPITGLDRVAATRALHVLRERLPRTILILAMHEPAAHPSMSLD